MTLEVTFESASQQPTVGLREFNYNALADETGSKVQQHTLEIKENLQQTISIIWEVGRKLFEIRNLLKPRSFKAWLESEFPCSRSTAYNNINVYAAFPDLTSIRDLPIDPSALYKLVAPSTPEDVRLKAVELAGSGEKITHKVLKSLIGSKTKKSVTSDITRILPTDNKEVDDVIPDAGEKESPDYLASFNTVTVDVTAQKVLQDEVLAEVTHTSNDLVEAPLETITVPSEVSAALAEQNTSTSDSSEVPTYNQTSPIFTLDSSTTTNSNYQTPATHAYNTCRALISNLEQLTPEEARSIFRAFLQKIGASAFSNFVKEFKQEEIATLCNQCFTFLNEQGLNWFENKTSNFTALSETAIKLLSVKLKRILVVRGSQRINQSQTVSQSSNLIYLAH